MYEQSKMKNLNFQSKALRLSLSALVLSTLGFAAISQERSVALIDPVGAEQTLSTIVLNDIDFTRAGESGRISVTFENGVPEVSMVEARGNISFTFEDSIVAEDQYIEMDVNDFGTAINSIETFQNDGNAKVDVRYTGQVTVERSSIENGYTFVISEASKAELPGEDDKQYTGDPISLDFQDVPVRQVLQIIAQVNGFNLVTTDTVDGNITISLSGVPWDQALDMILKIRGLDKRLEGNILLVAPREELTAQETQELQAMQDVQSLEALKSANITINYATAAGLASILRSAEGGILSDRGSVSVDDRTNTILIRDIQESIDESRRIIETLDVPVKQVLIESRMVTVRENVDEQLGVRWGFTGSGSDNILTGSLDGADVAGTGILPSLTDRLNVTLPVANPAGRIGFQIANLVDGNILDLELSALESENKGEIIASPRITVANQQEAYIEAGTEIPFVQAASSGATAVEFKKAVLSLRVTPQITPDDRIILNLVVTQDTRGETVTTPLGNAVSIDTQEISTQVLVKNGETIVLGGIFQQTSTEDVSKVPLFGDLPVVGNLFKTSQTIDEKRELLIFVTPKIIAEN